MLTDSMLARFTIMDIANEIVDISGYQIKAIEELSPHQRLWLKGLTDDSTYRKLLLIHLRGLYERDNN